MKTSSAKSKGRFLQQWVRDTIKLFTGLDEHHVWSTSMGAPGEDVVLSSTALDLMPLAIECKNLAKIAIYKHYEQACAHANQRKFHVRSGVPVNPCLIVKQNKSRPLAIVDADWFLHLLAQHHKGQ